MKFWQFVLWQGAIQQQEDWDWFLGLWLEALRFGAKRGPKTLSWYYLDINYDFKRMDLFDIGEQAAILAKVGLGRYLEFWHELFWNEGPKRGQMNSIFMYRQKLLVNVHQSI